MMLKPLIVMLVLGVAMGTTGWIVAQSDGSGVKRPLDLPSGGRGDDEDEEDAPETISFYGGEYEGDGFFWCLDKSGSMDWGGLIGQLKAEMTESISQLSEESEFSMVAFSNGFIVWSYSPKEANASNRGSATSWVMSLNAEGGTCLAPAGVQTINISNQCDKEFKQILVLSDGEPNCPGPSETLTAMTGANYERTPINTIYIASDTGGAGFMQSLASMNDGTFSQPN